MLFHVTTTHTPENCPGTDPEAMKSVMEFSENMEEVAKELNIKIHFIVGSGPEHAMYALLEADHASSLSRFFMRIPIKQVSRITPVEPLEDIIAEVKKQAEEK